MKTLYIHPPDDHPAHIDWANSIKADFLEYTDPQSPVQSLINLINSAKLPDYDTYLITGIEQAFLKHPKHMIYLAADEYLLTHTLGIPFIQSSYKTSLLKSLLSKLDACITISKFMYDNIIDFLSCPVYIVNPHIPDDIYDKLYSLQPDLNTHNILFIGRNHPINGISILIKSFNILLKDYPDSHLYIIGKNHVQYDHPNIHTLGYVSDFIPFIRRTSLFVMPGYGQAFCTAVTETMLAGLPAIVTNYTGAKEIVSQLNKDFVTTTDPHDIASAICKYFDMSSKKKLKLSHKAKQLAKPFNKYNSCKRFKNIFNEIII